MIFSVHIQPYVIKRNFVLTASFFIFFFSATVISFSQQVITDSTLSIPFSEGSLVIDGMLQDTIWQSALSLTLSNNEGNNPGEGGITRIVVRGDYLCLNASLPENSRLVAHSTGINPGFWQEDLIVWKLHIRSPLTKENTALSFAVNPLGAFCLLEGDYYTGRNDVMHSADPPAKWADEILAATSINKGNWTVEAAIPIKQLGEIGFLNIERIRPMRPEMPGIRWFWPAAYQPRDFKLTKGNTRERPGFRHTIIPKNEIVSASHAPETALAAEIAGLPKQVWNEEQRESLQINKMQENLIRLQIDRYAEEEKIAWQKVNNLKDWEHFRDDRLAAMRKWIGPLPEKTPIRSSVTSRRNYGDGFIIENIVYESRPNQLVAANLYLPEHPANNTPAMVLVHSLHSPKTQLELQEMGMTWAAAGRAVLVMDLLCAGERSQSQPWSRESYYGRYALGNQLYLAGESLIKWMAWDIIRGIDLLTERSYIDTSRIILLGAVAGGGDPAALAAVLDKRIAAVIPFNFGEAGPEEHYTEGPRKYEPSTADPGWAYWETTRNLPNSVSGQFFPWFICAAAAPRYFIYSFEIGWPKTANEEPAWNRYKKVFDLYGAGNHLAETHGLGPFPGPGEVNNVSAFLRKRIDRILNKWMQIPIPEKEIRRKIPDSDLICLTTKAANDYRPKPAALIALDISQQRLSAARSKRAALTPSQRLKALRAELAQKLGDIEPGRLRAAKTVWKASRTAFEIEALSITTEDGITLPFFYITPKNNIKKRAAVIAWAQEGKARFLSERSNEIAYLLQQGIAICLPDLRSSGELSSDTSRGPAAMGLAANELMLGLTSTGSRLKDLRVIFRWLAKRPDTNPKRIAIWGDSFSTPNTDDFQFDQSPGQRPGPIPLRQAEPAGSFLAVLAALYEDDIAAIEGMGMLISFSAALEDRFCHIPQDVIIPGILETGDIGDIIASLAPRPVFLGRMVDGRNKIASPSAIQNEYTFQQSLRIGQKDFPQRSATQWLAAQLQKK